MENSKSYIYLQNVQLLLVNLTKFNYINLNYNYYFRLEIICLRLENSHKRFAYYISVPKDLFLTKTTSFWHFKNSKFKKKKWFWENEINISKFGTNPKQPLFLNEQFNISQSRTKNSPKRIEKWNEKKWKGKGNGEKKRRKKRFERINNNFFFNDYFRCFFFTKLLLDWYWLVRFKKPRHYAECNIISDITAPLLLQEISIPFFWPKG